MKIYNDFDKIEYNKNTVLTLGTFDGVHLGHQKVISRLLEISQSYSLRHLLITIDPHPQLVLQKKDKPKIEILTTIEERLELFSKFGIQNALVIPFTKLFSSIKPDYFVENYLINKIGLKKMLIGYDHLFGNNREGNEVLLGNMSKIHDFDIEKLSPLSEHSIIVSSTKIRNSLYDTKIELANEMLGYNYFISGIVVHGDGRGKEMGFPTANICINNPNKLLPANGVYLVSTTINNIMYYGMANLGNRPTFKFDTCNSLEVYLFDFLGDLYNKFLYISFIKYIRTEIKFNSIESLINQIKKDEVECRSILKIKI